MADDYSFLLFRVKVDSDKKVIKKIDLLLNVHALDSLSITLNYEKLAELNELVFNPIFLISEKTNLNKLETLPQTQINELKSIFKQLPGLYRKRMAGKKQAFLTKKEFAAIVASADV